MQRSLLFVVVFTVYFAWPQRDARRLAARCGAEASLSQPNHNDRDWELLTMALVGAATVVVMWEVCALALARIDAERRRRWLALLAALVFALFTSMLSTTTRSYWQHGPDMFFLSLTLLFALRARTDATSVRWMGMRLAPPVRCAPPRRSQWRCSRCGWRCDTDASSAGTWAAPRWWRCRGYGSPTPTGTPG